MHPGHHELGFQARGQRRIPVAQLRQRPVGDIDRLHPAEQRGVGLGHLMGDLGPLPGIAGQRQRFLQPVDGGLAAGVGVGRRQFAQHTHPFCGRRRLGERAAQQLPGLRRCAGVHRGPRRLPQAPGDPRVAGRLHVHQMGSDLTKRAAVPVELASGARCAAWRSSLSSEASTAARTIG